MRRYEIGPLAQHAGPSGVSRDMRLKLSAFRLGGPAVAFVAATLGSAALAAPAAATCRAPSGASAVHRSATVVVYRRARTPRSGNYWGCLRSSGRRTALPGFRTGRLVSSFRSAGRHLAFFVRELDGRYMTGTLGVRVFDLRAGKARRGVALDISSGDPQPLRFTSLVVTATGAAAWRETGRGDRIAARDLRGRRRVLASGRQGSIRDLVLRRGAIAQWRNDGELQRRRINRLGR